MEQGLLLKNLEVGMSVMLDDGKLQFQVVERLGETTVSCEVRVRVRVRLRLRVRVRVRVRVRLRGTTVFCQDNQET